MLSALILDFDGLIVDTEGPAFEAWSAIYREHGVELRLERWVACVGAADSPFDPVTHLDELLSPRDAARAATLDRLALFADKDARKKVICDAKPPLPGVVPLLDAARRRNLKLAVASSSSRAWVTSHLERVGLLSRFDLIRGREDVPRAKPYPDVYLAAAAGLGVLAAHCLVCEDSLNGVRAAKAAGMRVVAVPNAVTKFLDFSEADARLTSLTELDLGSYV